MYGVTGLDFNLTRKWKSEHRGAGPLSQILWVVGPHYGNANLGYGWEILPRIDDQEVTWRQQEIIRPTSDSPFWGVRMRSPRLDVVLTDVMHPAETIWMRHVSVSVPKGARTTDVAVRIPVHPDPRNGPQDDKDWGAREREGHVDKADLVQLQADSTALVLTGARRRLYSEYSSHPMSQKMAYPSRVLATSVAVAGGSGSVSADSEGFTATLGKMRAGETRELAIWLATAPTEAEAAALLATSKSKSPQATISECRRRAPPAVVSRTDGATDPLLDVIRGCRDLCYGAQAHCGGVLASPYMYPMCYVRDQYGSFRFFLALHDHERARQALAYHIAMENQWGFQNSYEAVTEPPDPTGWTNAHPDKPGEGHGGAEVPSYLILMARDYYLATGDLEFIKPLYARLAYNLRIHNFDPTTHLLPSPGDESYTQLVGIGGDGFTDSNTLFLGAAEFMTRLADSLGHEDDEAEFKALADRTREAMIKHLWMPQERYFAISLQDRRPAFDPLLRPFQLDIGDPQDAIHQGCLDAILDNLVNPIRVVPEYTYAAGMDPGYLLYALSRSQNAEMHAAARLVTHYSSDAGSMSEYYKDGLELMGGRLRPWESGVAGWAMVQYLLGFHPDMPAKRLFLQPHLPPGWPGWTSGRIPLGDEGELEYRMERAGEIVTLVLRRFWGVQPLRTVIEFGGANESLRPETGELRFVGEGRRRLQVSMDVSASRGEEPFVKRVSFREQ